MNSAPTADGRLQHPPSGVAILSVALYACIGLLTTGCGTPGAPAPPSLHLPVPASDLSAVRSGSVVTLQWTNPRKTTDRLLIKGTVHAQICWQSATGQRETVETVDVEPGSKVEFHEPLPATLQQGQPHAINFFVELKNRLGRSAGPSNLAPIVAGSAPPPVADLHAEVHADGAALFWQGEPNSLVRLHRKLLTAAKAKSETPSRKTPSVDLTGKQTEPILRDLIVEPGPQHNGAVDPTAHFGETYEYTAQRLVRVSVNGKTVELAGDLSAPVRIDMTDTFPPAVPGGLEAIAVPDDKTIDLSWQPGSDNDLSGYIVYRAEAVNASATTWTRISGPQLLTAPAFRDTTAQPGQAYRYAVTAVDATGHESARSPEARETLTNP
jgi:hypothetical protein